MCACTMHVLPRVLSAFFFHFVFIDLFVYLVYNLFIFYFFLCYYGVMVNKVMYIKYLSIRLNIIV